MMKNLKHKRPGKLTAKTYNRLVKVFNDASTDVNLKADRDQIIALRKQFPTYSELAASGIKFVEYPTYLDENGNVEIVKSWTGSFADKSNTYIANILEAEIVYTIGLVRSVDPETLESKIGLKVRGVPKKELV
ncbi:hypothetical protein Ac42p012 [Acinetobacter phage Ac42]|uniref:hypothetical protein n=1 Tax=Acinetobacter phage Ac42 TaxID=762660 RepID=UPI0001EBCC6E|nr:hypothetical protein Ac42p012 [Acinetobacter phage Ac42]ADI96250.1 hypothetical protein Ac42p012 [Acinetobacter phage Ac42]